MLREIAAKVLTRTGVGSVVHHLSRWSGVVVLNYHRIGDAGASQADRGLWSATAADFDAHVSTLASLFDIITPDELPDVVRRGTGRYAMITFDDGYADNYLSAFPVLRRRNVRATFFITTGFIDSRRNPWWDEIAWMVRNCRSGRIEISPWLDAPVVFDEPEREGAIRRLLRVYKGLPALRTAAFVEAVGDATGAGRSPMAPDGTWMTWDMLREMRAAGMAIGGHTVNHPVLANLDADGQRSEVEGCLRRLREEIGEPIRSFSYPVGGHRAFDATTRRCLADAGVTYAFSYYGGVRRFGSEWDDHDVQRLPVERYMDRSWVRAMVTMPSAFARAAAPPPPAA
jgi:peptidoglycan/xylan/chitin deacetylase (PgdA/CDA1 family)